MAMNWLTVQRKAWVSIGALPGGGIMSPMLSIRLMWLVKSDGQLAVRLGMGMPSRVEAPNTVTQKQWIRVTHG